MNESNGGRFCIEGDNDGHNYVIPFARRKEWADWLFSDDYGVGTLPDWAKRIDAPSMISFTEWKEESE